MTDGLMLALLVSLFLTILALKLRSLPVLFVSSLGWLISGLQVYEQTAEILPMGLLLMVAFAQFFLITPSKEGA